MSYLKFRVLNERIHSTKPDSVPVPPAVRNNLCHDRYWARGCGGTKMATCWCWLRRFQLPLSSVCAVESRLSLLCDHWRMFFRLKNRLGRSAVVFCVCKVIQLFSVVFVVVRLVLKFDFRIWPNSPQWTRTSSLTRFLVHTQTHHAW
jgi:hypothetical protein